MPRCAIFAIACLTSGILFAAGPRITFTRDVQPILVKHCQSCHSPGQVAPMPLLTYADAKPQAAKIKELVAAKKMPPVIGTPHYTVLTRGEGLTQSEISTLVKWADAGAPQGAAPPGASQPRQKGVK